MSHAGREESRAYPRDEFDKIGAPEGRRGAHRAKASPVVAMLPVLLVVVAVVAVVVGTMSLLGGEDVVSPVTPAAPAPAATEPAATEPAATEPAAPASPAPAEPELTIDTSVPVTVLNGTRTAGLAGEATGILREAGWMVPEAGNYREGDTPPTTVFYASEELAATAQAVAEDLGGAATALNADLAGEGLTVVLGEDYEP